MAFRIEIGLRRGVRDPRGLGVVAKARKFLKVAVRSCHTRDVYKVDMALKTSEQRRIRDGAGGLVGPGGDISGGGGQDEEGDFLGDQERRGAEKRGRA